MKKRSRLRRRIREWLNKRKERTEENPLPSFAHQLFNLKSEQSEKPMYPNDKTTRE